MVRKLLWLYSPKLKITSLFYVHVCHFFYLPHCFNYVSLYSVLISERANLLTVQLAVLQFIKMHTKLVEGKGVYRWLPKILILFY